MRVTKQMRTETAHRLNGHPGRCRFLHGHSYLWEVTVDGLVDDDGMVIDFSELKKIMTEVIDPYDHAVVVEQIDTLADILGRNINLTERVIVTPWRPTAENMAQDAADKIRERLLQVDMDFFSVSVRLWETSTSYAEATA